MTLNAAPKYILCQLSGVLQPAPKRCVLLLNRQRLAVDPPRGRPFATACLVNLSASLPVLGCIHHDPGTNMRLTGLILLTLSLNAFATAPPAESFDQLDHPFPDFTFVTPANQPSKISDYQGKVVVVKVWATWCGICRAKWPRHQALYDSIRNDAGVEMITLQLFEDPRDSQAWVDSQGFDVPLFKNPITDRGAIPVADGSFYFLRGTPTVFLIDKRGTLRKKVVGNRGEITEADIRQLL